MVAVVLGTMLIRVMDRHQPAVQQVVIPVATPVVLLVVLVVPVEVIIPMALVVLVLIQMVILVVMRLEGKVLAMVDKEVWGNPGLMALMADLAVVVDHTQAQAVAADIPVAVRDTGTIPAMAAEADPISRIRPQIQAVRQEKMKVMVRSSLPIALVSALNLRRWWPITIM